MHGPLNVKTRPYWH